MALSVPKAPGVSQMLKECARVSKTKLIIDQKLIVNERDALVCCEKLIPETICSSFSYQIMIPPSIIDV